MTAPFRDTTGVPTNTRIWCPVETSIETSDPVTLKDASGVSISGTQTELHLREVTVLVFRPDVELNAESTYTYDCPHRDAEDVTFRTGTGPATTAPAVPDVSHWEAAYASANSMSDSYYEVRFEVAAEYGSIVVLDVGGEATLQPEAPSGAVSRIQAALQPLVSVAAGTGSCSSGWPDAAAGASTLVSLGVFDVTGAFSGWSNPIPVTIPSTIDDRREVVEPEAVVSTVPAVSADETSVQGGCGLRSNSAAPRSAAAVLAAVLGICAVRRRGIRRGPGR